MKLLYEIIQTAHTIKVMIQRIKHTYLLLHSFDLASYLLSLFLALSSYLQMALVKSLNCSKPFVSCVFSSSISIPLHLLLDASDGLLHFLPQLGVELLQSSQRSFYHQGLKLSSCGFEGVEVGC